jgi:diacylglycerol kinase (ATP)
MNVHSNQGFPARFGFALRGLAHAAKTQNSLRLQGLALLALLVTLAVLRPPPVWWALLLLASGAVLAAELLNTAIEELADALHPEDSPAIGRVKDCAAAAVLIASLAALGVAAAFVMHCALLRN